MHDDEADFHDSRLFSLSTRNKKHSYFPNIYNDHFGWLDHFSWSMSTGPSASERRMVTIALNGPRAVWVRRPAVAHPAGCEPSLGDGRGGGGWEWHGQWFYYASASRHWLTHWHLTNTAYKIIPLEFVFWKYVKRSKNGVWRAPSAWPRWRTG